MSEQPSDGENGSRQDDPGREREAAMRQILEIISQSRDDEAPVFDSLLRNAARLCKAENASMVLVDNDKTHFRVAATLFPQAGYLSGDERFSLDLNLGAAICMREARVVHRLDLRALLEDTSKGEQSKDATKRLVDEGVRTTLWVPLLVGDTVIGSFGLYRHEVREFTDDEIALVQTFAAQAVIAIENVRQFRELQTRLEREAATRGILEVISRSRSDYQPVFDRIVKDALRLCDAEFGGVFDHLPNDTHIRLVAQHGLSEPVENMYRDDPPRLIQR